MSGSHDMTTARRALISCMALMLAVAALVPALGAGPVAAQQAPPETSTGDGDDNIKIAALDVGQADALVIWSDNETMVVDSGNYYDNGQQVISFVNDTLNRSTIDYLVSTHTDTDHIGGHEALIENMDVESVYRTNLTSTSATYEDYISALENSSTNDYIARSGDSIPFGAANVTVLHPTGPTNQDGLTTSSPNDDSLTLHIRDGDTESLLTGDLDTDTEIELAYRYPELVRTVDLIKAGHHGAATSTDPLYLEYAEPNLALISAPVDSTYGHPENATLNTLNSANVKTGWTGISGTIIVDSNGTALTMSGQVNGTTDPAVMTGITQNPPETTNVTAWNISNTATLASAWGIEEPAVSYGGGGGSDSTDGDGDDELLTGVDMTDSVALGVAAFALALALVGRERL